MGSPKTDQLKIAIVGSGIASSCLAYALCQCPNLHVRVFEASATVREDGAAVELGSNAQEALRLMSSVLRDALDRAGGVCMRPSVRIMMGTGPESGRHIGDIDPAVAQIVVHRGKYLHKLRNLVPKDVLVMDKTLVEIETTTKRRAKLVFADGSTYKADAVVGCDGISSTVRKSVLDGDDPAVIPRYIETRNHRVVIPLADAKHYFGDEYCSVKTQHRWIGENGFLSTDFVDDGASMQVIAGWSTDEPWPHRTPFVEWPKKGIRIDLASWGDIGKKFLKVFNHQPKLYAAGLRTHLDTSTYAKGHCA